MQYYQPYDVPPPQPTLTQKEQRIALWLTIGGTAAYALSQLLSAGNARRNSNAWKKEVKRRIKADETARMNRRYK